MQAGYADDMQNLVDKLPELPPERIAEVADFIDFLRQRRPLQAAHAPREKDAFPTISVGQWPNGLSLRREGMYGNDGR